MYKIQGYFLYRVTRSYYNDDFLFDPLKIYASLQNAKHVLDSDFIAKSGAIFIIVPIRFAFDNDATIKYVYCDGKWSRNINPELAVAFYKWRNFFIERG